jgi:uncharacterized protein (TIGR02466 family)
MQVDRWFPVQVGRLDVEEEVRLATEEKVLAWLKEHPLEHHAEASVKTSFRNGERNLFKTADLRELEDAVLFACFSYMKILGVELPKGCTMESWVNVCDQNAVEQIHDHFGSFLSGCYYVAGQPKGGEFFIQDPVAERRLWGCQANVEDEGCEVRSHALYEPLPGRILIFQSWMPHGVLRQTSDQPRISVAFNLNTRWK